MKNLLFTFIILFSSIVSVSAQLSEGTYKTALNGLPLIGNSEISSGVNGVALNLSLGYCLKKNTSLDLIFSFSDMNNILVEDVRSKYQTFTISPTFRQSLYKNNSERFIFFGEIGYGLGYIKYNAEDKSLSTIEHERYSGGLGVLNIGVGCNYFITKKIALEGYVPYIHANNLTSEVVSNVYSGVVPAIGFMVLLN